MMPLEVLVTAVSERADLFIETMDSLLQVGGITPARIVVHEDCICERGRPRVEPGPIWQWLEAFGIPHEHKLTVPARGLGPAMLWCFQQATQPIVFYTQEDWRFVREVPVVCAVEIMEAHSLNHVRWNKRKTMRAKHEDTPHPWHKLEVEFPMSDIAHRWCVSDHWYTQASLWRVAAAFPGLQAACEKAAAANPFVAAFNDHQNRKACGAGYHKVCMDPRTRHEKLRTYIWGPVGEPRFIEHLGSVRTTGPIVHKAGA